MLPFTWKPNFDGLHRFKDEKKFTITDQPEVGDYLMRDIYNEYGNDVTAFEQIQKKTAKTSFVFC